VANQQLKGLTLNFRLHAAVAETVFRDSRCFMDGFACGSIALTKDAHSAGTISTILWAKIDIL